MYSELFCLGDILSIKGGLHVRTRIIQLHDNQAFSTMSLKNLSSTDYTALCNPLHSYFLIIGPRRDILRTFKSPEEIQLVGTNTNSLGLIDDFTFSDFLREV